MAKEKEQQAAEEESEAEEVKPTPKKNGRVRSTSRGKSIPELRILFSRIDKDGNETIDIEEMADAMKGYGMDMSFDDIVNMVTVADTNEDGVISFDEFINVMDKVVEFQASPEWSMAYARMVDSLKLQRLSPRNSTNDNDTTTADAINVAKVVDAKPINVSGLAKTYETKQQQVSKALTHLWSGELQNRWDRKDDDPSLKVLSLLYNTNERFWVNFKRNLKIIFMISVLIIALIFGAKAPLAIVPLSIISFFVCALLAYFFAYSEYRKWQDELSNYTWFLGLSDVGADATMRDYVTDSFVQKRLADRRLRDIQTQNDRNTAAILAGQINSTRHIKKQNWWGRKEQLGGWGGENYY